MIDEVIKTAKQSLAEENNIDLDLIIMDRWEIIKHKKNIVTIDVRLKSVDGSSFQVWVEYNLHTGETKTV